MTARSAMTAVLREMGVTAWTIVAVAIFGSALLLLGQSDPWDALQVMVRGVFASKAAITETLLRFAPLAIVALGLAPSLRLGLFNIGAPGQIGLGALSASLIALYLPGSPYVVLPLCGLAGALGGALAAFVPGILRARLNVNEILSTLVFNFLILLLLQYLLTGPLHGYRANLPQSDPLPVETWLPLLVPGTRAHIGLLLVPVAFLAALAANAGPVGYRMRLLGASASLGRQAGLDQRRYVLVAICTAGAAAGIAGWMQTAGVDHRLYATVAAPMGYTGLFAALVGRLSPIGILASSFVFAALLRGGDSLQIGADVSPEIVDALIGLIMLVMAMGAAGRGRARQYA